MTAKRPYCDREVMFDDLAPNEMDILGYTNYINCPECHQKLRVEVTIETFKDDEV